MSNICLDRTLQPLTSSSNYNSSQLETPHVNRPSSLSTTTTQIQPSLTLPATDFSSPYTFSQSSSSSPSGSFKSNKLSKSTSTSFKIKYQL